MVDLHIHAPQYAFRGMGMDYEFIEWLNIQTFPEEAFYMATKGGGEFFGKVGSFEEGYEFDALVLDDSILTHPLELTLRQRIERSIYLPLDMYGGIKEKYIQGNKVI